MEKYWIGFVSETEKGVKPYEKNSEFENLTWSYHDHKAPNNLIGYGPGNTWTPPLEKPDTFLGYIDRHIVTFWSGGPIWIL